MCIISYLDITWYDVVGWLPLDHRKQKVRPMFHGSQSLIPFVTDSDRRAHIAETRTLNYAHRHYVVGPCIYDCTYSFTPRNLPLVIHSELRFSSDLSTFIGYGPRARFCFPLNSPASPYDIVSLATVATAITYTEPCLTR